MASQKRQRRSWHDERNHRAERLPPGPANPKQLGEWSSWLVESLTNCFEGDEEIKLRLHSHFLTGFTLYTDYSGIDCPRESLRLGLAGLCKHFGWDCADSIHHARASDKDPACRQVLMHLAAGRGCVFGDILDRLPKLGQEWIESAMPPPNATLEQRRDAFGSIVQWVQQNAEMLFPDNATSWCYAHGQECPAHPLCRPRQTPFYQRPLMICCAGVSCLPWTSEGSQDADASECEVPHGIWMAERKLTGSKLQEDIAFVECTPRYPIEKVFQQSLEDTHFCVWVRVGPELMGWPHKRLRVL